MTTATQTTIPEKPMDFIPIDWNFLEANLTTEVYQQIQMSYQKTSETLLSNYNLGVILKRWIREYPQIKTIKSLTGLYSALVEQEQMELEILESLTSNRQRAMGITDMEILVERDRPLQNSERGYRGLEVKQGISLDFTNDSEVI